MKATIVLSDDILDMIQRSGAVMIRTERGFALSWHRNTPILKEKSKNDVRQGCGNKIRHKRN